MEMKIYERSLQALLSSAPSLARSREAHFAYPNRRACSQARQGALDVRGRGRETNSGSKLY